MYMMYIYTHDVLVHKYNEMFTNLQNYIYMIFVSWCTFHYIYVHRIIRVFNWRENFKSRMTSTSIDIKLYKKKR